MTSTALHAPVVGLFEGYGGLTQGVTAALADHHIPTILARVCDNDPNAAHLLAHRHPDVPNLGDITTVDWTAVRAELVTEHGEQAVRGLVLTGGFPCQDISAAGRRAGLRPGTRSGLWAHMRYAIHQLRPALVIIENVRGLTSADADSDVEPCPWCLGDRIDRPLRALGAVLGDLAALGLDAEWAGVHASDVGAPHGRCRIFILAWPAAGADTAGVGCGPAGRDDGVRAEGLVASAAPEPSGTDPAVGDAGCGGVQRRADSRGLAGTEGPRAGEGLQRERWRDPAGDAGAAVADPGGEAGHLRTGPPPGSQGWRGVRPGPDHRGHAAAADPAGDGRHERRPGTDSDAGRAEPASDGRAAAPDPAGEGRGPRAQWGWWPADAVTGHRAEPDGGGPAEPRRRPGAAPDADGAGRHQGGGRPERPGPAPVGDRDAAAPDADRGGRERRQERDSGPHGPEQRAPLGVDSARHVLDWGVYEPAIRRWEAILGRAATPPTMTGARGGQQLAPLFVEWMMGLPAGWVCDVPGLTRAAMLKLLGNGVVPQQATLAVRVALDRAPEALAPIRAALTGRRAA